MPTLVQATARSLRYQVTVLGGSATALWGVAAANTLVGGGLIGFGIHPLTVQGLWAIPLAPLLHANAQHLLANTVPLLVFGWLILLGNPRRFWTVTALAVLGSGLTAWTFGAPGTVHVGASGVVFGYFGFLLFAGWFTRSIGAILMSLGVAVAWGGLVFGVLPGQPGISWQSHLGGFLGGALAAKWLARRSRVTG